MIKALISVRFRGLWYGFITRNRKNGKRGKGMTVLFGFLFVYLAVVICGALGYLFYNLAGSYHTLSLDWLYFAMAGLMALAMAVLGSVFTTQNQLYDARDNELLLSMPIPPRAILLSRMVPLLLMNLLFGAIVFVPAIVVYALVVGSSVGGILLQILSLLCITGLAQAVSCVLGWLLHLLLSKVNKSVASMTFMVVFLGLYFYVYFQASSILSSMALNGDALAHTLQTWVWPVYALGLACLGDGLHMLATAGISVLVFALMYWILSATFLKTAVMGKSARRKERLDLGRTQVTTPKKAIIHKELRKFLGSPVYLTNMGLGVLLTAAAAIAGLIFRNTILNFIVEMSAIFDVTPYVSLLICAVLAFTASTCCISTPSVSLEGKSIWILKSMPVSPRDILDAKLRFHCKLSIPVMLVSTLALSIALGCTPLECALSALVTCLLLLLNGLVGLAAGLKWARLDSLNDAYPCKQSAAVLVTMFGMMGLPLLLGLLYGFVLYTLSATVFLVICALILLGACFGFHRLVMTWGVRKWEAL